VQRTRGRYNTERAASLVKTRDNVPEDGMLTFSASGLWWGIMWRW
jgi:hypothetical protein